MLVEVEVAILVKPHQEQAVQVAEDKVVDQVQLTQLQEHLTLVAAVAEEDKVEMLMLRVVDQGL